ncbi:hypothetical protein Dfri01_66820 [Dyadobacter frigoris]|uniref:HNH endonuclease n=1 Tax=Dyadobacter frigoris TaxID=2576211 RepID=UPI0024A03BB5|nr:HNH endonuclease [Dyadobacter frigoris]GLU57221.1 hypothetical protein Dfri01_66820 [Dyadobacter frigoris]
MPKISHPYVFSTDYEKRLQSKFSNPISNHKNWQDDDITDIRSSIRDYYRLQQNGKCAYCNQSVSLTSASNCQVEHIVAKSKYIKFIKEPRNLCVICADCNEIKRNQEVLNDVPSPTVKSDIKIYPRSSSAFKIVHPHFDDYDDHLLVINGYYLDKTTKGGNTILFCNLNRKLHKLGYENPIFSEIEVIEAMTDFMKEADFLKRTKLLTKVKEILILV